MVKLRNKFLDQVVISADLPSERLPGQPLIEVAGDRRVLIENHIGITAYGCTEIHVKVCYGAVRICGQGLELANMTKQQLVITGKIDCVTLQRGNP